MSEATPPDDINATADQVVFPAARAKAFADAVVAIAMTLLILPLMDSVAEVAGADQSAGRWFVQHQLQLLSFVLSFVIIAMFWISHHRQFSRVERVSTPLLWIMMAWLLSIVWLPVATAMSGQMSSTDSLVKVIYIGSMILTALLSLANRRYLRAHPALHDMPISLIDRGVAADLSIAVLFAVALAVSLVFPVLTYYPLFLMFLSGPVQRLIRRMRG